MAGRMVIGLRRGVLCFALAGALIPVAWVGKASALSYDSVMRASSSWRECTSYAPGTTSWLPGCVPRGTLAAKTRVHMHCWLDDAVPAGYKWPRWFYVTTSGGVRGFVYADKVGNQTVTPPCKTQRGIAAARWAAMQIGETVPSSAEKAGNASMDRWSGWCYVLAADSYVLSTGAKPRRTGTAGDSYNSYKASGLVSTDLRSSAISIGSIIFWKKSSRMPVGHAAIYLGNGYIASTQGTGVGRPPNYRIPLTGFSVSPSGWVSPTNVTR
jgi:hypothetical protein